MTEETEIIRRKDLFQGKSRSVYTENINTKFDDIISKIGTDKSPHIQDILRLTNFILYAQPVVIFNAIGNKNPI